MKKQPLFRIRELFGGDELQARIPGKRVWMISLGFHAILLFVLTLLTFAMPDSHQRPEDIVVRFTEKPVSKPEPPKVRTPYKDKTPVLAEADIRRVTDPVSEAPDMDEISEVPEMDIHVPETDREITSIDDLNMDITGLPGLIGFGPGGNPGGPLGRRAGPVKKDNLLKWSTPEAVSAIRNALRWLARHQEPDGHWSCAKYGGTWKASEGDPAVTGLALLAFLGDGNTEFFGRYRENVRKGIAWLADNQEENGRWGERNYEQGICLMAVAESTAMGGSSRTREAAIRGTEYALSQQNPSGAWNYRRSDARDDMSVTGWNVMGLKSAMIAGIRRAEIREAFRRCSDLLDRE